MDGSWEGQRDKGVFLSVCNGRLEHVYKFRSQYRRREGRD